MEQYISPVISAPHPGLSGVHLIQQEYQPLVGSLAKALQKQGVPATVWKPASFPRWMAFLSGLPSPAQPSQQGLNLPRGAPGSHLWLEVGEQGQFMLKRRSPGGGTIFVEVTPLEVGVRPGMPRALKTGLKGAAGVGGGLLAIAILAPAAMESYQQGSAAPLVKELSAQAGALSGWVYTAKVMTAAISRFAPNVYGAMAGGAAGATYGNVATGPVPSPGKLYAVGALAIVGSFLGAYYGEDAVRQFIKQLEKNAEDPALKWYEAAAMAHSLP